MTKKKILDLKTGIAAEVDLSAEEQTEHDARVQAYQDESFDRSILKLRKDRNQLLTETDFYGYSDVTMSDDMKTYRQALRDLPSGKDTVEKCENATWPTKP
jgi:hypothetical protein